MIGATDQSANKAGIIRHPRVQNVACEGVSEAANATGKQQVAMGHIREGQDSNDVMSVALIVQGMTGSFPTFDLVNSFSPHSRKQDGVVKASSVGSVAPEHPKSMAWVLFWEPGMSS